MNNNTIASLIVCTIMYVCTCVLFNMCTHNVINNEETGNNDDTMLTSFSKLNYMITQLKVN